MRPGNENSKARVLVVDDHAFMRMGIRATLAKDDALEVVGEAEDGEQAVAHCRALRPDLVLMDLSMPRMDGIEATRAIKAEFPKMSVLVLTAFDNQGLLLEAVEAGAAGYILKGSDPRRVLEVVRAVLKGETPLEQGLAMRLIGNLAGKSTSPDEQHESASGRETS